MALILFAFVLFGLELFITSHGMLGIGGAISLVLGGLLLTSGNDSDVQRLAVGDPRRRRCRWSR